MSNNIQMCMCLRYQATVNNMLKEATKAHIAQAQAIVNHALG